MRFKYIFDSVSQNVLKTDLKKSQIQITEPKCPIFVANLPALGVVRGDTCGQLTTGYWSHRTDAALSTHSRVWCVSQQRRAGVANLASKMGQTGPKLDKSVTF